MSALDHARKLLFSNYVHLPSRNKLFKFIHAVNRQMGLYVMFQTVCGIFFTSFRLSRSSEVSRTFIFTKIETIRKKRGSPFHSHKSYKTRSSITIYNPPPQKKPRSIEFLSYFTFFNLEHLLLFSFKHILGQKPLNV